MLKKYLLSRYKGYDYGQWTKDMDLLLALGIPIVVLGLAYLLINNASGLPVWLERLTNRSGVIWTYGVIIIAVISIVRYASGN